jgi:beta-lactamase regulating signal transducer with metallopeptidase domain
MNEIMRHVAAQSWQVALLTAAVAILTFALRRRSAHVRYLLWLIVVAKCLLPPLHTVPLRIPLPTSREATTPPAALSELSEPLAAPSPTSRKTSDARPTEPAVATSIAQAPHRWFPSLNRLASIWIIGVGVYLAVNLRRAVRGHRKLRETRRPLPEGARAEFAEVLRTFGTRSSPRIWIAQNAGQPFVWGVLRGSIYVPAGFFAIANIEHRRDILAHELSHVLRFDAAVNTLQIVAQTLFWFHPLVWWANHSIRREREKCCDETVIARLRTTPKNYSTAIVEALARMRQSAHPSHSLAVAGPLKHVEERIRTVLRPGGRFYRRPRATESLIVAIAALTVLPTTLVVTARTATNPQIGEAPADFNLPQGWTLEYDDGWRTGGALHWAGGMARDLCRLTLLLAELGPADTSWKNERYEFEVRSPGGDSLGTVDIRFDLAEMEREQMTLKPGRYRLDYRRGFGVPGDNFRIHSGPFFVDLPKPGMYTLRFAPRLGTAEITGSPDGCYAVNFERIDSDVRITGFAYQNDKKRYLLNGLPAGTYRLSAVTQDNSGNVLVSQAQATVKADEKLTLDIAPPPQGNCSLRGVIGGRCGAYWTPGVPPQRTESQWFVLIRERGCGPVEQTEAYEAQTMDSRYAVRGKSIVQETADRASYSISGVAPGEYTVTVIEHPWCEGIPIERQQSRPLTLRPGETVTLDFDLGNPPVGLAVLPPLDQIGHAEQVTRTTGKRLLICFFDVTQRRSRNRLLELNERVESLAAQNVLVLAVQTSDVETDTLDKWLKQNNIAIPVSRIAAPGDDLPAAWGVKGFPWLIVTDDRHVVVAEGVELADLGEAIPR